MTSYLLHWSMKPFQKGVLPFKEEQILSLVYPYCARGLTHTEKDGKNENGRVASPDKA